MYKCRYFDIRELVPPSVYDDRDERAWELLDSRMLITLDALRLRYGPITVNNWHTGGDRHWSGLRTPDSPWYKPYSQHTFGRAADCIFHSTDAESVRQDILANPDAREFELIMSIELGTSWIHFDVRNCVRIKTYTP